MTRRWRFAGIGFGVGVVLAVSISAATMIHRSQPARQIAPAPVRALDELIPEGALIYVQARDFAGLLKAWNNSPEKAAWVASDNHSVFSQSRLFLRLERFFRRFGSAAGVPADTDFVVSAAGKESALALYDIGKIHFVYITRLNSADFLSSDLWRSRSRFQSRMAAGATFFLGKDEESRQVVAFATVGDYLVLTTREDLMVKTLQLLDHQPERSLRQESWYSEAVAAAPQAAGDLRMVLDMKRIAVESHFRTYWVQQNITEMEDYRAAVSDLYCEGNLFREERVLLRNKDEEHAGNASQAVAGLLGMLPADYGFYQVSKTDPEEVLEELQQAILPPEPSANGAERYAPQLALTGGEVGSASDLEIRIDAPASRGKDVNTGVSALKKQIELAGPTAFLEVQSTRKNADGGLLAMPRLLVISAAQPWDSAAVQKIIRSQLANTLTVSEMGMQWKATDGYLQLDGLHPLYLAIRDKLLYLGNQPELLTAALQSTIAAANADGATYVAAFNHAREHENFYGLTRVLDMSPDSSRWPGSAAPRFFSQNMAGLSRALARLESEKVVEREESGKVFQTVTYRWIE